jgi:hypothetical protein
MASRLSPSTCLAVCQVTQQSVHNFFLYDPVSADDANSPASEYYFWHVVTSRERDSNNDFTLLRIRRVEGSTDDPKDLTESRRDVRQLVLKRSMKKVYSRGGEVTTPGTSDSDVEAMSQDLLSMVNALHEMRAQLLADPATRTVVYSREVMLNGLALTTRMCRDDYQLDIEFISASEISVAAGV